MSARRILVTGTDTGVGKTHVCLALIGALRAAGLRVAAMKPVASGCRPTPAGLRNDDAERLRRACVPAPPYDDVNPFAFADPIAPHIAARRAGVAVTTGPILAAAARLAAAQDVLVVEGVGGWRVPLAPGLELADLAAALDARVLLVVGLRLGCINHALLTAASIEGRAPLLGWIANAVDPGYGEVAETIECLRAAIPAPLLGVTPHADAQEPARGAALAAAVEAIRDGLRDSRPLG